MANESGIEILSKRDERCKHFDLGSGIYQYVGYTGPIHYKNETNDWEDIILNFNDVSGKYVADKNKVICEFRKDKSLDRYFGLQYDDEHRFEATVAKIELNGIEQLGIGSKEFLSIPELKSSQTISNKFNPNVEIINKLNEVSLKNYYKITPAVEDFNITEQLHLKGLVCSNKKIGDIYVPDDQNTFNFVDEKGDLKFWIFPPFFIDADQKRYQTIQHILIESVSGLFYTKTPTKEGKDDLILAKFPIEVDADTFYANIYDQSIGYNYAATWATAHDSVSGNEQSNVNNTQLTVMSVLNGKQYLIYRTFLYFDTSSIGAGNTVTDAVVSFMPDVAGENGSKFSACLQKGTQPTGSLALSNYANFSGTAYVFASGGWIASSGTYFPFILNAAGCSDVVVDGTTKYCWRSYTNDYLNVAPLDGDFCSASSADEAYSDERRPKLVVTYTAGGTTTGSSTILSDARIKTTSTLTKLSDVRVKSSKSTTTLSDARIKYTNILTKLSDASILNRNMSATILSDALITTGAANKSETVLSDARIKKSVNLTSDSDARVKQTNSLTALSDARIKTSTSTTKVSDARIKDTKNITTLSDARVKYTNSIIITSDARVRKTLNITSLSDARIQKINSITSLSDARIKYTNVIELTSNARIKKTSIYTLLSDGRIQTTSSSTKLSDARIRSSINQTILSDARIKKTNTITFLSNARIKKPSTQTINSNAKIMLLSSVIILSDAEIYVAPAPVIPHMERILTRNLENRVLTRNIGSRILTRL